MRKRFQNGYMVLASLLLSLFRRSKKSNPSRRYIVIQPTGNLGDMVCITPIFHAIKVHQPDAYVAVVGAPKNRDLIAHCPDVDEYIDIPDSPIELARRLHKGNFDFGVAANLDASHLSALYLCGVETISCFVLTPEYIHMQPWSYTLISSLVHTTQYFSGKYVPSQYLNLLRPFGIEEVTPQKILGFSTRSRKNITEAMASVGISADTKSVAIAPGAGADFKRWPVERFGALANQLYATYRTPIIIIGGPKDQCVVKEVLDTLDPGVQYWNPGPRQSLDELKATLACAYIVIGNDSGAIHVGEAVGSMTLTIGGATDVGEHMVEDSRHRIVIGDVSGARYQAYVVSELEIHAEVARAQMESVTTNMVVAAVNELMQQEAVE